MAKRLAFAYAVAGVKLARDDRSQRPLRRRGAGSVTTAANDEISAAAAASCRRHMARALVKLGPPVDMSWAEREALKEIASGCAACGVCPDMQTIGVTALAP